MERKKVTDKNKIQLVKEAINYLERGYAIIFPTDTLYALGVDALNEDALKIFFSIKKRSAQKPVPVFVSDIQMAHTLAFINKRQEVILQKLWSGAFTVVLEKRQKVSLLLTAGTNKIGLRIPSSDFAYNLVKKFGRPITSSSANISGMSSSANLDDIVEQFKANSIPPDFVIDGGTLQPSEPSTVIDITGLKPKILRINQTTLTKLQDVFDKLDF